MIINRRHIAHGKVDEIADGQTAFADSKEVARLMKREIKKRNLHVHIDDTAIGSWFIPERQ